MQREQNDVTEPGIGSDSVLLNKARPREDLSSLWFPGGSQGNWRCRDEEPKPTRLKSLSIFSRLIFQFDSVVLYEALVNHLPPGGVDVTTSGEWHVFSMSPSFSWRRHFGSREHVVLRYTTCCYSHFHTFYTLVCLSLLLYFICLFVLFFLPVPFFFLPFFLYLFILFFSLSLFKSFLISFFLFFSLVFLPDILSFLSCHWFLSADLVSTSN